VAPPNPYLRRIDSCITQLKAQGPSRTCNESKEEEDLTWSQRMSGPTSCVFSPSQMRRTDAKVVGAKERYNSWFRVGGLGVSWLEQPHLKWPQRMSDPTSCVVSPIQTRRTDATGEGSKERYNSWFRVWATTFQRFETRPTDALGGERDNSWFGVEGFRVRCTGGRIGRKRGCFL